MMRELTPRQVDGERDPDGVRVVARDGASTGARRFYQAAAVVLVAACVAYVFTPRRTAAPAPGAPSDAMEREVEMALLDDEAGGQPANKDAAQGGQAAAGSFSTRPLTPRRMAVHRAPEPESQDDEPDGLGYLVPPGETRKDLPASEYIQALHDAGIHEGIGAFNPPGTSPPLEGVAVPPDFELPEGYVRHFQTTDDGQPIDPILMYSPDYEFVDDNGQPVAIPDDRVVPPDRVPAGMPVRTVEIPKPREPGDISR